MRRREIMALIGSALAAAGCAKSYSWNQKLTVEVNTPEGVKTGSSVVSISVSSGQILLSQTAAGYEGRGDGC
jgi:hypothetical protein